MAASALSLAASTRAVPQGLDAECRASLRVSCPARASVRATGPASLASSFRGLSLSAAPAASLPAAGPQTRGSSLVTMSVEVGVGVLGNKVGMLTYFTDDGLAVPCTVIGFHEGNIVTQVKSADTDGYSAVQVGYRRVRDGKLSKPEEGHTKKVGAPPLRHLQEWRVASDVAQSFAAGQQLNLEELFKEGDIIDVSGTSIGKGFAGGIKRHNFARGNKTHGSKSYRQLGSIGAGTTPGRVYPGKKMPGHLGNATVKIRKLTVVKVDPELHALIVRGSVPGKTGNLLRISPAKIVGKNIPKN